MSNSPSSDFPVGWAKATLPELIGQGGVFNDGDWVESKDQDPDGDVRLTQLADVGVGRFLDRSSRYLTNEAAARLRCTFLETGDVLVARMPDPLGRACMFPGSPMPCVTVVDVCIVRPSKQEVDPRWLMWTINAPQFQAQVDALQSGTTRRRISRKNLATIPLPIPPLPEQRRIVAEIDTQFTRLDAAVAALVRARANLKRYRAAVREGTFTGPLAPVSTVLKTPLANGRSVPSKLGGFPVLRLTALKNGWVDLGQCKEGAWTEAQARPYTVRNDDFLIARGNGSLSLVGRGGLVRTPSKQVAFPDTMIRVRCDDEKILPRFLRLVWDSPSMRNQIETTARTTAGIHKISQRDISAFLLPVPTLAEQLLILEEAESRLSAIDKVHFTIEANLKRAERMRQAILRKAFAGQLAPQDPDDEPASKMLERILAERESVARRLGKGNLAMARKDIA